MIRRCNLLAVVKLRARNDAEVFQRSLINQTHFAADLESRALAEDHLDFVRTARGAEHQEVPSLIATIDADLRTHLRLLRRLRNAADYDTELSAETISLSTPDACDYTAAILAALDRHRAEYEAQAQQQQDPDAQPSTGQDRANALCGDHGA